MATSIPNPVPSTRGFGGGLNVGLGALPGARPPSGPRSGFTATGNGVGNGGGGGGAPSWACALIGQQTCSYADLIAAGINLFGGGGSEPPTGDPSVPGTRFGQQGGTGNQDAGGPCPGLSSIYDPVTGRCVNVTDAAPGGDPLFTAPTGEAVHGRYGAGVVPAQQSRTVRMCPSGWVLGDDGVCYERLARSRRMWDPGMKPLLTGGDRAAIRKAARAASKLKRAKKQLRKSSRALEKAC